MFNPWVRFWFWACHWTWSLQDSHTVAIEQQFRIDKQSIFGPALWFVFQDLGSWIFPEQVRRCQQQDEARHPRCVHAEFTSQVLYYKRVECLIYVKSCIVFRTLIPIVVAHTHVCSLPSTSSRWTVPFACSVSFFEFQHHTNLLVTCVKWNFVLNH